MNEYGIEERDVLIISIDILYGGPPPENKYYSTNIKAVNKRGNIGEEFFYLIIGSEEGTVWGDKIYTDDSNIAKAAVLEGKCELGEEAFLGIKMIEGKSSYSSSSKNGINSSSWGSWPASYIFIWIIRCYFIYKDNKNVDWFNWFKIKKFLMFKKIIRI